MQLAKLNGLGAAFVKDKTLFHNHVHSGIFESYVKACKSEIVFLDDIKHDASLFDIRVEIEKELATALVYLKQYLKHMDSINAAKDK